MRNVTALRAAVAAVALSASVSAEAVWINPAGHGQALIFPYYTVRASEGGNAFNTYLSVTNHAEDAKAVRVRLREGRAGREVLALNLYLPPKDVWTAAVVPTASGARLITGDASCTDPPFQDQGGGVGALDLRSDRYTGASADGFGDTLDRTREGFVEMLEMSVLTGQSASDVWHINAGTVPRCAMMRANATPTVAAPTGGLSGTLTLINMASGLDFTLPAEALAGLATRPFFRLPADPYPDFNAAEIDAVSVVVQGNQLYRATWTRPVDAVTAVMMRSDWMAEYVGDSATASQTDVVITLPTRHHYVTADQFTAPFRAAGRWDAGCGHTSSVGENLAVVFSNRGSLVASVAVSDPAPYRYQPNLCAAAAVASVDSTLPFLTSVERTHVLGSLTRGFTNGLIPVTRGFENGWLHMFPWPVGSIVSGAQSTRTDLATGAATTGAQTYSGLPAIGFMVRTFRNGAIACASGSCQGNYGGAFSFKYRRSITSP